jgi:hypothetical protein
MDTTRTRIDVGSGRLLSAARRYPEQRDRVVRERAEEVRDANDTLAPFIGMANALLASFVVWAFLGACMLAVYQLAPSWVVTTVQGVLLAGGAR